MFDGLFSKKPTQTPPSQQKAGSAPPQPAQNRPTVAPQAPPQSRPPAVAGPMEVAKANVGADFQSVVDEAAIVFAGGEEKAAADMLIDFLKQTNGQANRRVWFMLLDIYQALTQKEQYEKLSLMFANRFGTSPPSWEEALGVMGGPSKSASPPPSSAAKSSQPLGRNVLILEGSAADQLNEKSKDYIAASREMKSCKLDISRMKVDQTSLAGLTYLQGVMFALRKHKVSATLMGENHVAKWLEKKINETKVNADINDSPYWMLYLEILQWRGMMEPFEEMSLEYTMTFEVSGPGWESNGIMTIEAVAEVEEEAPSASSGPAPSPDEIVPDEIITDVSVQRIQEEIAVAMSEKGMAKLNFRKVRRMAFSSAGAFLNVLGAMGEEKSKRVVIINPSELILALGDVIGFSAYVTIVPRKR